MQRTRLASVTTLFILLLAAPGSARHCNGEITTLSAGGATLYLDDRSNTAGELNHWLYLESNGVEGLQSGGDNNVLDDCGFIPCIPADHCEHHDPDRLII